MTLSTRAQRVRNVLRDSGPRKLTVVDGLVRGTRADLCRVVGELFIAGVVKWIGRKKGRRLAAVTER